MSMECFCVFILFIFHKSVFWNVYEMPRRMIKKKKMGSAHRPQYIYIVLWKKVAACFKVSN